MTSSVNSLAVQSLVGGREMAHGVVSELTGCTVSRGSVTWEKRYILDFMKRFESSIRFFFILYHRLKYEIAKYIRCCNYKP